MTNPFRKPQEPWHPNFDEIHEYSLDLQRITLLRDKTPMGEERERYDNIIKCMQLVMVVINSPPVKLK